MVTAPEKNFIIAVKLPFDLQARLLAFPFLHVLQERYPEAELHFITPKVDIEVLNLLPFKAYYYEFDDGEIQTVFDVHRFAVNSKIPNVDLFISLTNSFPDACLGMAFKAKQRLGFSDNWKTLVLNQKIARPHNHHITEDYFSLWKTHLGGEIDTRIKVISRDLTTVIQDWDKLPYIAVNLSPIKSAQIEPHWIDLISHFENQRFVFFASEEQDKIQILMENFLAKLPKKNLYESFMMKDWIERAKMLAFARGVVTFNGPAATVSAYVGSKTLVLFDREDPQRTGPYYFLADVVSLKPEERSHGMGTVADRTHEFFKL